MNLEAPHLHLMVNHLPVLGVPFALILGVFGLLRRQDTLLRAALVGLVVAGGAAWATQWSGDEAEEIVEELPGVAEEHIHEHEEAGENAARGALVVGGAALLVLLAGWRRPPHRLAVAVLLLLAALLAGWLAYTANLGGEIRHPEIRPGFTPSDLDQADDDSRGRGRGRGGDGRDGD